MFFPNYFSTLLLYLFAIQPFNLVLQLLDAELAIDEKLIVSGMARHAR